jgi:phosphatidylglycerol:prolipoprotein diacylglycerol transferase
MLRFFNIGENNNIPSYNLFVGIGIAIAMMFLQYQKLFKSDTENNKYKIHLSLIISIILGFIGAFLFDAYSKNIPLSFKNLNQIGLTFFGGLISGLSILIICLKVSSLPVLKTLNILAIPFCIAHCFGRLGCFMAGCCFGCPTKSFFGVTYPIDSLPYNHYHALIKIHPTQLYECAFLIFLFLVFILFKTKNQFYFYIISYSIFRFNIEFIRADDRGIILNQNIFSPSQLISVLTLIIFTTIIVTKNTFRQNN